MSKQSEIRGVVSSVLDQHGIVDYAFSITGGKHQKVSFVHNGARCSYIFASTASDSRTLANTRAGVRRLVRAATRTPVPGAPADRPVLDARRVLPRKSHDVGGRRARPLKASQSVCDRFDPRQGGTPQLEVYLAAARSLQHKI